MGDQGTVLEADWTWTGNRFEQGIRMEVSSEGMIESVNSAKPPDLRLTRVALIPGLVSVHSHAFQRGLRGLGETFSNGRGNFWTWREELYRLASQIDKETLYRMSTQAFREMLRAGITCVGEFHYLHHEGLSQDFGLDEVVLRAAADVGIRIVLISTYYRTGGIGRPLSETQSRFRTASLEEFWNQVTRLSGQVAARPTQTLGVSAHSVRAVPLEDLVELCERSCAEGRVFHMHLEEQEGEVQECLAAYGLRPLALVNKHLRVGSRFTAVHATQAADSDLHSFLEAGGNLCVCPLTEASLGDGIPRLPGAGGVSRQLCVGTDSNLRISLNEELRWLEYVQRLQLQGRGILRDEEGSVARCLFRIGTCNGSAALGVPSGSIEVGRWADFAAIDLEAGDLSGWNEDTLLAAFIFGSDQSVLKGVAVGGRWTWFRV